MKRYPNGRNFQQGIRQNGNICRILNRSYIFNMIIQSTCKSPIMNHFTILTPSTFVYVVYCSSIESSCGLLPNFWKSTVSFEGSRLLLFRYSRFIPTFGSYYSCTVREETQFGMILFETFICSYSICKCFEGGMDTVIHNHNLGCMKHCLEH